MTARSTTATTCPPHTRASSLIDLCDKVGIRKTPEHDAKNQMALRSSVGMHNSS